MTIKIDVAKLSDHELFKYARELDARTNRMCDNAEFKKLVDDFSKVEKQVLERHSREIQIASDRIMSKLPFVLKFLHPLCMKYHKASVTERIMDDAIIVVSACRGHLQHLRKVLIEKEKNRKRDKLQREAIDFVMEMIVTFVEGIRDYGHPKAVRWDAFQYQKDEVMYLHMSNATCVIRKARSLEKFDDGHFVITNQRVMFISDKHKQVFRVNNIRDFDPCWEVSRGRLRIASSDKRNEEYVLNSPWIATAIIMYIWNENFKDTITSILDAGVGREPIIEAARWLSEPMDKAITRFAIESGNEGNAELEQKPSRIFIPAGESA